MTPPPPSFKLIFHTVQVKEVKSTPVISLKSDILMLLFVFCLHQDSIPLAVVGSDRVLEKGGKWYDKEHNYKKKCDSPTFTLA